MPQPDQPLLHDLVTLCAAPTQALSDPAGGMAPRRDGMATAQGLFHADVRVLSGWRLEVAGRLPAHLATELVSEREARFVSMAPGVPGGTVDRFLRLDVVRGVAPGALEERLHLHSDLATETTVPLRLELACDLAPMELIKMGRDAEPTRFTIHDGAVAFGTSEVAARAAAPGAQVAAEEDGTRLVLTWPVTIGPGKSVEVGWRIDVEDSAAIIVAASGSGLSVEAVVGSLTGIPTVDVRLRPWLRRSLEDLDGLRVATRRQPDDAFFAAGAPWYFTLFGRDSLWTSRLLLGVDVDQAGGTLRALAGLAGTAVDVTTAEEPGKIPHELRRGTYAFGGTSLPPLYYGTVDATPLWICLLHDAWRAGLPEEQVRALLPTLEHALGWLTRWGDADGDGFLEYLDASGHGLANQGWKDSRDSVRFADGRIAEGPVALCEVQGYAYEAAVGGAALLDAFGLEGADRYRSWAADLATRFRSRFWCGRGADRYPAMALDGAKRRVDAVTSNIGHLLGTGLLNTEEEALVARRLTAADLDSGLGLRTMSSEAVAYSPLSYHCGSVWPHDTAIAIAGLERCGHGRLAAGLVEGLLRAAQAFDARLPELWSGEGRPVPYPAACRPQAWSAAAAVTAAEWLGRHRSTTEPA
ncbi:Glycogen debranching enzyme [Nostocoides japonicum T1-X7]|uniref:Glycogen debranching enzyme n=1 Tax=Nostocoides japonicum T1-X7 TaxID=1194083 RepID=A0A077LWH0_9MICO|nr:glycogen debranching N-terminal domain-containing protein [Tetrasphaera japonica]CCH78278.1 Glycogen debranching enzyme [Tetrasphaera japonica T1-X7]